MAGPYQLVAEMGRVLLGVAPIFRTRFRREVEASRRVSGAYTAAVVDADADADANAPPPWLASVFVPGPSLREVVETVTPLPPESAARLAAGLAAALAAGPQDPALPPGSGASAAVAVPLALDRFSGSSAKGASGEPSSPSASTSRTASPSASRSGSPASERTSRFTVSEQLATTEGKLHSRSARTARCSRLTPGSKGSRCGTPAAARRSTP